MRHETGRHCTKRLRIRHPDAPCWLGRLTTCMGEYGARFGEIVTVMDGKRDRIRDIDVTVRSEATFQRMVEEVKRLDGIEIIAVTDVVREMHLGGKIATVGRVEVETADDLSLVYTPGVASICQQIEADPALALELTGIQNTVAIVTNGTAILGLGDIGPRAGMPVMEGKALLFHKLAGISGVPILLGTRDTKEIIAAIRAIAPTFGAIKLEDIKAPECFEIEEVLDAELDIPVMHDDQHGTATVVLAALLSVARKRNFDLKSSTVGIIGLGAAGAGIHRLLKAWGVSRFLGADINPIMSERFRQHGGEACDIKAVMTEADTVIATTGVPRLIEPHLVRKGQVILALSNPDPEISPDEALAAGALFAADGKGVNNAMAFPGLFKGALVSRARSITDAMKIAAAETISANALPGELMPDILNTDVHRQVAEAVARAAD